MSGAVPDRRTLPDWLRILGSRVGIVAAPPGEFLDPAATRERVNALPDDNDRLRCWNGLVVSRQLDELRPVMRTGVSR